MRKLHIYCDGGFGNRFNGLIAGHLFAEAAGLEPLVVWPVNNWCGAAYSKLIANQTQVVERELLSYAQEKERYQFFMTEDHLQTGVPFLSPLAIESLQDALRFLAQDNKDVFFHTPLIPSYLNTEAVHHAVQELRFDPELVERGNEFMAANKLDDFFGIHIRKTDFGRNGSDDNGLFDLVQSVPSKVFFVCSDDKEVEMRFGALPNVVVYPKRAYVEKLVQGDWNTATADHSGRVYSCNVNRGAESVEDAIVDLLLLSHSQIVSTSNSTFRNTALLVKMARQTPPSLLS
jgi:hypothetical protein